MDIIALCQQQFRQIGAILAGDAGDEGGFLVIVLLRGRYDDISQR